MLSPKALSLAEMKIEFLDDISKGGKCPQVVSNQLVRLYDFDTSQAAMLKEAIQKTEIEGKGEINLSSLEFIDPVNCNLNLRISKEDIGIMTQDKINFVCCLTIAGFKEMIYFLVPFCVGDADGYQWLYDLDCPIDFLFSPGGTW